ncbi:MAG: NAD-dependent epimerase/dehydratase family protein [Anaerolineae bacterium]
MKALVTGGTGFVGSHIVRALNDAGHTARVLHRPTSKLDALAGLPYESAPGDILDETALLEACKSCDWVFHVAAVADYWRADKSRMFEANVEGTRRVLQAAKSAGVKRVVFTSSAAAVGLRSDGQPAAEDEPFNLSPDRFPYGYSKVLAEKVALEAAASGQDVVITNPVVIMGPGDLNMISGNFVTQVKQLGPLVPVPPGGIAVIDVRDVAQMHLAAAERGRSGERYILNTDNYTQREWLGMIADVVRVRRPFIPAPAFSLPIVATLIDWLQNIGIKTPIDGNQTRLGARNIHFDGAKGWAELGKPQINMRQSLEDTYRWYVENGYIKI